ncbi:MAG: dephospho-CoA kinase [Prochlorococcus sp.]|jgi:dephospho-CoA kinase|nr:dephospho-CoA kinase [Gammaproteobacteria bacterium]GIR74153.1 MAG: dephospho-CoA kinase [Prochlorococcus sp.]|tara:strand:+ start:88 stop:684 length:597 start_codon:yes stop_codon:yes gene_type:complete
MIVGLTGGIGSGKSVAGDFFIELGIDVIDADHVSKNILDDNESAKKLFLEHFGEKFIDKNNNVDRALLRDEIFKNEDKKEALESIIHPLVREEIFNFIENSNSVYKIIMVPLIYETNSQDFYDKIVVVDCKEENQIIRASKRDNKTKNDIINIMKNQASSDERMSIADEVIKNDSSLDDLKKQVIKVHQKLLGINIDD